ncbi:MAG: hypothetical protein JW715_01415, partial [Sedimentisphaerales bacterium]|nr:hypothetical protein [Sedimentisphaerales bacterium]
TLNVSAQFQAVEVTHTISGSVGVGGVTMRGLLDRNGQTVVTDESGYYIAVVKWGFSGVVTPQKEGWTFTPLQKEYKEITGDQNNQDYTPSPITYSISGTTGVEGVRMVGLPGDPITGSGGLYSVQVDYGFTATVTPTKDGYEFSPKERPYRNVGSDLPKQDYTPTPIKLTISGSAGTEGVELEGFPTKVVSSGSNGNYSVEVDWNWSGTVRPVKQGYSFMPEEIPYSNITFAQPNQDYIATPITYTISGSTGLAGVEMKGFPESVFTDQNGYYRATVPWGWSGNVSPQSPGHTFKPGSTMYSKVDGNRDNQNYEATEKTFTISGMAGQADVQMFGLPGDPVTDSSGRYSVTVPYNWTATVTPTKEGYEFDPPSKAYPAVSMDYTNQNYTAKQQMFEIRGSVEIGNVTLQGLPGGRSVVSANDGSYAATVPYGWNGTITPQKVGYEFSPVSIPYTNITGHQMNQNYVATLLKRRVSGIILSDKNQPVAGVVLTGDFGVNTTTDTNGRFEFEVDYGWRGMITPVSEGHTFRPPNKQLTNVIQNLDNVNFSAIVKMLTITDQVSMSGTPIPNVKITATDMPGSTATDTQGMFSIRVPYGWTGEVLLEKPGFNFNPPSKSYTNVTTNLRLGQPVIEIPTPERQPIPRPDIPTPRPVDTLPPDITTARPGGTLPDDVTTARPGGDTLPPVVDVNEPKDESEIGELKRIMEEWMKRGGQPGGPAQPFDRGTMLITDNFDRDELQTTVVASLTEQAGIPIIPENSVYAYVSCSLNQVPLDQALDIILAGTPYIYKKTPYYYLISPPDPNGSLFTSVSETRPVRLDYVRAIKAVSLLNEVFMPYVKADPADPNSHTVLVTAPPKVMERIIADLELIDKTPAHIMLDAKIVVLEKGGLLNLGSQWSWPNIRAGLFSNELHNSGLADGQDYGGKWPWGVSIGYTPDATFTNALEIQLNLLQQNNEARIVSKPTVMALEGKTAKIQVLKEEYYVLTSSQTNSFGYSTNYLQDITAGTTLTITPYIGDDNQITLEMAVEVSDSQPSTTTGFPVVTRRIAENIVRVEDGGTAVVAGLTENRTSRVDSKVPGLSSLPVVGSLFKNKNDAASDREIAVFVKAQIVPEGGGLGNLPMGGALPPTTTTMQSFQQLDQQMQQQPTQLQPMQQPQQLMPSQYNNTPAPVTNPIQQEIEDALYRR